MDQLPDTANNSDTSESNSIAVIMDSIGAFLGKVPASLQRNVVKVAGQLLSIPSALITGKADELKALSKARVKIIEVTGEKLAQTVDIDTSLAKIATQTYANKILRQQANTINILKHAAEESSEAASSGSNDEPAEISEDWINAFESRAVNMSSEYMQKLFGRILAGEIRRPTSFSVRTVNLVAELDNDVAVDFRKLCSMAVSFHDEGKPYVAFVVTLGEQRVHNCLHRFGLGYSRLLALAEYGLIVPGEPASSLIGTGIEGLTDKVPHHPFHFSNTPYRLTPPAGKVSEDYKQQSFEFAIVLTRAGRELLNVVEFEHNQHYADALFAHLTRNGLILSEVQTDA